ncbi:hypothetical protein [Haloglycomyces albus]|uniref:hypothetical protein n=1 Tax=Haloglycomyces albus TaxID=526067 RepID=UPI00046D5451|nr:hypothetical protein [Haloglycomyces albus]
MVISAVQVGLFGVVLPLLMLGPIMLANNRPSQQQLTFVALMLIPTTLVGSAFIAWWAMRWLDGSGAPEPTVLGISLVIATGTGLLTPLKAHKGTGPAWLKPLMGVVAGIATGSAMLMSLQAGLSALLAVSIGIVVLGLVVLSFRAVSKPLGERRRRAQIAGAVRRFQGQLVDLQDSAWTLLQARGDANTLALNFSGSIEGKNNAVGVVLKRDIEWVPQAKENEAAVFELSQSPTGVPTEAVLQQKHLGSPASVTLRIPGTTVMTVRETIPDTIGWGDFMSKFKLVDVDELLERQTDRSKAKTTTIEGETKAEDHPDKDGGKD